MFIFGGGSPSSEYQISRSLRFNSADSANCTRTFGTPTTQDTFTFSAWVKRSALGSLQNIFGVSTNNSIGFPAADTLVVTLAGSAIITTSGLYRDPSAWAHIVYRQTTGAAYLYWNNVEVGTSATVSAVFNTAVTHTLGAANAANYFNGYLSDVCFIDGQSLAPSSFGQTNSISGAWEPKSLAGLTAGANGFWLKFADNSSATTTNNSAGLGIDSLSTNYWTTTNFSVTAGVTNDSLTDTPTNYGDDTGAGGEVRGNYCIFNPLDANTVTLSDGNAKLATAAASWNGSRGSIAVPATGHWYFEITVSTAPGGVMIGVSSATAARPTYPGTTSDDNSVGYFSIDGKKYINGAAGLAYGDTYTSADVIGVEINAGTLTFYKNNVSQGSAQTGMSGDLFPHVSVFNNGGDTVVGNFGQRQFTYTAPAGAKAICTQNLTNPTIAKPSTHFDIDTYTGTAATRTKTGVGFQPDLVWFKGRSGATDHAVYDVARGVEKRLETNNTDDEVTGDTTGLTAFTSDGYTEGALAQINTSAATYAAWMWKCGGAAASNTSGSITSSVSTNPTAGVSIGTYTGQTAAGTVGHGLGVVPKLIIVKARTTASTDTGWAVYHGAPAPQFDGGEGDRIVVLEFDHADVVSVLGRDIAGSGQHAFRHVCFPSLRGDQWLLQIRLLHRQRLR